MASKALISTVLILWYSAVVGLALSCDSCGRECKPACGTRSFRTCCFNYLKKRNVDTATTPEMRLELLMVVPEVMQYYQPSLKQLALPRVYPPSSRLQEIYRNSENRQQP